MTDFIKLADQLAQKNSQWLFLFTLIVLASVVFLSTRWLVNKYENLMKEQRSDQQAYTTSLVNINAEFARVVEKNTAVVENNTEFIERCRDELIKRDA